MGEHTAFSSKNLIGQVLQGNYLIEKPVGKGGMAWVYRARHTKLQETMAVKILLPHIAEDEGVRRRFLDEAKIQFRLKHPNIVQVTDVIEEGNLIGIVLEWVDGEDLKELLKRLRSPMPISDIWRLMAPVLDAVGYAHHRGLIHRDLKPANIMLHNEGRDRIIPKVTDFGIAKLMDEAEEGHTRTGVAMGTIKYMAPEQILDSKHVDPRADIYSLGVILYFMATARLPFKGESQLVIYKQLNEPAPPPSSYYEGISPAFEKVLLRCLERDREKRYQTTAELSHALSLALLETSRMNEGMTGTLSSAEIQEIMRSLGDSDSSASLSGSGISLSNMSGESSFMLRARPTGEVVLPQEGDPPEAPKAQPKSGGTGEHTFGSQAGRAGEEAGSVKTYPAPASPAPAPTPRRPQVAKGNPAVSDVSPNDATVVADDLMAYEHPGGMRSGLWMFVGIFLMLLLGGLGWFFLLREEPKNAKKPDAPDSGVGQQLAKTVDRPRELPQIPSAGGSCKAGDRRPCYEGPAGTEERKPCQAGLQLCKEGKWGRCIGQLLPQKERCNGVDDDCDGKVDEDFAQKGQACAVRDGACAISGVYQCSEDQSKLICQAGEGGTPDGVKNIRIKIAPANKSVKLHFNGQKHSAKGSFCIPVKGSTRLRVEAPGYYQCAFSISQSPVRIQLKRRDPMDLDPSLSYCKR